MDQPQLKILGIVHSDISRRQDAPKNYSESEHKGSLEIYPEYHQAMEDIRAGETIVALFWLHKADRSVLKVHPRGDHSRKIRGVFSTRSPARPNPIAISELRVYAVEENCLKVVGLDIIDGTPILDIKKKI